MDRQTDKIDSQIDHLDELGPGLLLGLPLERLLLVQGLLVHQLGQLTAQLAHQLQVADHLENKKCKKKYFKMERNLNN